MARDAYRVARVRVDVEADHQRVELAVVGEHLERLLRVVWRVEQLDPGVELLPARLEHALQLLRRRVQWEGAQGLALDPLARDRLRQVGGQQRHLALCEVGRGVEGELVLANVADLWGVKGASAIPRVFG
eukprot:scaffold7579_cov137-Isochrysis_galbana.AAC.2